LSVQGLADHFGTLLEKTISAKPIKLQGQKIRDKEAPDWLIGNYAPDRDKLPTIEPIELKNGGFLRFEHRVRVLDDPGTERNINKTTTLSYSYEYSATSPDDPDWILRYEYETEPQDPKARYPAGHLHVNAEPRDYTQIEKVKNFPLLHLPTSRLSIEKIIWHLASGKRAYSTCEKSRETGVVRAPERVREGTQRKDNYRKTSVNATSHS